MNLRDCCHEAAHVIAVLLYGVSVDRVGFHPQTGDPITEPDAAAVDALTPYQRLVIALASERPFLLAQEASHLIAIRKPQPLATWRSRPRLARV